MSSTGLPSCGGKLHLIGETISEMLDHVPARLRVIRICRPRYAAGPAEPSIRPRPGNATASSCLT
jgi:transposase